MKKICASTLSANGSDRLKARASEMRVVRTSGASMQTMTSSAPKAPTVMSMRRRMSLRWRNRHHRQMSCAGMKGDVRLDAVQRCDIGGRQHLCGLALRQDTAVSNQDELRAQRGREIQIVRANDHRRAAIAVQPREQRRNVELRAEIERSRRLVEEQRVRRLRQRA